ncbi:uncharacterized protein LOC130666790 isoform X2 [Microplitis mediator]|uniref:uncharacterized protein LOC130666790 isoform X2 n=1 Tax=Microplitis mediator TaxID=375433 RepID=UPI0025523CD4|nr:uncharacterized protein LOC130666790 isoform X2 [Microplitis mediator]
MAPEDKIGQISADEVKLMENIEFDKKIAEYTGFVDLGKYTSESDSDVPEDHALVFMFVPYRGNSAQPLGCFITKNLTDAAQFNRGVWTKLVDTNNISCEHLCESSRRLYMISDFPHLVKCFRNGLVELDEFELYSREVRCAMTILRENGNEKFEGSEPTEKFIKIIDDGIQAMTSHDAKNALYFKDTCEQKKNDYTADNGFNRMLSSVNTVSRSHRHHHRLIESIKNIIPIFSGFTNFY